MYVYDDLLSQMYVLFVGSFIGNCQTIDASWYTKFLLTWSWFWVWREMINFGIPCVATAALYHEIGAARRCVVQCPPC